MLMQVIRGEEIRVRSKVSAHRRRKRGHRKETTHENLRQCTTSPAFQQLQQARHSVWIDIHVITSAATTQQSGPRRPDPRQCRTDHAEHRWQGREAGRDHRPYCKARAARTSLLMMTRTVCTTSSMRSRPLSTPRSRWRTSWPGRGLKEDSCRHCRPMCCAIRGL